MFTSVAKHLLLYRLHTHVLDKKYFICIGGYVRRDFQVLLILSLVLHAGLIAMVILTVAILFSSISNLVFKVHFPNERQFAQEVHMIMGNRL